MAREEPDPLTDRVVAVSPDGLQAGPTTPGVTREVAVETAGATVIRGRAEPRARSGWHHHGQHEVFGYVVRGQARFEFGPAGREVAVVVRGGFFHVPAGLVHRDVNPLDAPQEIIITVVGSGPLVVNVAGPEAAAQPG
jgi:uncharacterized RmlC-like cupin family protein